MDDHKCEGLIAYPSDPRPAVDSVVAYLRGDCKDPKHTRRAAYHLLGYVAGKIDGCCPEPEPAPVTCERDALCKHLEAMVAEHQPTNNVSATKIPWRLILAMLVQILEELLDPTPEPPKP